MKDFFYNLSRMTRVTIVSCGFLLALALLIFLFLVICPVKKDNTANYVNEKIIYSVTVTSTQPANAASTEISSIMKTRKTTDKKRKTTTTVTTTIVIDDKQESDINNELNIDSSNNSQSYDNNYSNNNNYNNNYNYSVPSTEPQVVDTDVPSVSDESVIDEPVLDDSLSE